METLDSYSFPWIKEKHSYVYKNFDPIPVPNITLKRVYSMPENGYWKIVEEPEVTVLAGLVGMSQPSFGFVVKEVAKSGIMNTKKIQDAKISVHQLAELKVRQFVAMRLDSVDTC